MRVRSSPTRSVASRVGWLCAPVALALAATPLLLTSGPARASAAPPSLEEVTQVYLRDCASCHGAEGRGTTRGPALVGVGKASTDYYLTTGRMPIPDPLQPTERTRPAYRPEMIAALVDYVAAFGPGGPDIPHLDLKHADLAEGGKLYQAQCAACHAWAGDGGALIRREAPPLHQSTPIQTAEAIRAGPGAMPGFGPAALSDEQLNAVVAYVEYLKNPSDRGGWGLWHIGPLIEGAAGMVLGMGTLYLVMRKLGGNE